MSIGYSAILRIRRVEEQANRLGFRFAYSKYGTRDTDVIALFPKDDAMPDYSRNAELFVGDIEQVASFLNGMEFMTNYYKILRIVTDKNVAHKEDLTRQRQLIEALVNGPTNK